MGTKGLRTAHDRTKILWIGEPIYSHQKGCLPQLTTTFHKGFQVEGFRRCRLQHNSLMNSCATELGQASPGNLLNQNTRTLCFPK